MKQWVLGALCAAMACGPVGAAVRIVSGPGTAYFMPEPRIPDPVFISVIFSAVVELDERGNQRLNIEGGPVGTYTLHDLSGKLLFSGRNDPDNRSDFDLFNGWTVAQNWPSFVGWQGYGTITSVKVSVPEPSTWALLILGFGAVGFGLRMRPNSASSCSRRSVRSSLRTAR